MEVFINKINDSLAKLNQEANENWMDEKVVELWELEKNNGKIVVTLKIGKWDFSLYEVIIGEDYHDDEYRVKVIHQCNRQHRDTLDSLIHYVILPILKS